MQTKSTPVIRGPASVVMRRSSQTPSGENRRGTIAVNAAVVMLITGASGVGKSTVRELVAPELWPEVECVELSHLSERPLAVTGVWRQQAVEAAVRRAV